LCAPLGSELQPCTCDEVHDQSCRQSFQNTRNAGQKAILNSRDG
jgi:hypothetical protein